MKKAMLAILSLLLCAALLACGNGAALPGLKLPEPPSGEPSSGNGVNDSIFASGSGSLTDPYIISTAEQWQAMAAAVNGGESYSGKFIALSCSIDFGGAAIAPVGNIMASYPADSRHFAGTLDGKGHVLSGFKINSLPRLSYSSSGCIGLFGYLTGTVKDLGIRDASVSYDGSVGHLYAGVLAGLCRGEIRDCSVDGSITVSSSRSSVHAGSVGYSEGSILRVVSTVTAVATASDSAAKAYCGGVVGLNKGALSSCLSAADLKVYAGSREQAYAGAVTAASDGVMTNCCYSEASFVCGVGDVLTLTQLQDAETIAERLGLGSQWMLVGGYMPAVGGAGTMLPSVCPSGSYGAPIAVSSLSALRSIDPYRSYTLTADIKLSGWTPIPAYYGTLFGGGHTLSSMTVSSSSIGGFGLVGLLCGNIENIHLTSASITASGTGAYAGTVAGICTGSITDCTASGRITNNASYINCSGGMAGYLRGGSISGCTAELNAEGKNVVLTVYIGGMAGRSSGTVARSSATVTAYARSTCQYPAAGGIAGFNEGLIEDCYAISSLHSEAWGETSACGGIAGINRNGTVRRCYAGGTLYHATSHSGGAWSAGIAGDNRDGTVDSCLAIGSVRCDVTELSSAHTGYIAAGEGIVTDCCYSVTSEATESVNGETLTVPEYTYGTACTVEQITSEGFISRTLGWSEDIWDLNAGSLPTLK